MQLRSGLSFILSVSICLVFLPLSSSSINQLNIGIDQFDPSEIDADKEDVLEKFLETETDRLVGPLDSCSIGDTGVDVRLDDLAESVASVAGRGKRALLFQESLAKSINLSGLGREKGRHSEEFNSKGILDVLEESNPSIVHSRQLNAQSERDLIQYLSYTNKRLAPHEKDIVLRMFNEAHLSPDEQQIVSENWHEQALDKLGGNRLKQLVLHEVPAVSRIGLALADQLYLSPTFLEYLPVVGVGITALKRIGRFPYEIIKNIRSLKQHVDVLYRMPGKNLEMKVKAVAKSQEGRAMLSAVGLHSLRWLAVKLIDRFKDVSLGRKEVDEIVQRCAYYILMHVAVRLTECKFS